MMHTIFTQPSGNCGLKLRKREGLLRIFSKNCDAQTQLEQLGQLVPYGN